MGGPERTPVGPLNFIYIYITLNTDTLDLLHKRLISVLSFFLVNDLNCESSRLINACHHHWYISDDACYRQGMLIISNDHLNSAKHKSAVLPSRSTVQQNSRTESFIIKATIILLFFLCCTPVVQYHYLSLQVHRVQKMSTK